MGNFQFSPFLLWETHSFCYFSSQLKAFFMTFLEQRTDDLPDPFSCQSVSSTVSTSKGIKYTGNREGRLGSWHTQGHLVAEGDILCPESCRTTEVSLVESANLQRHYHMPTWMKNTKWYIYFRQGLTRFFILFKTWNTAHVAYWP